jgi:predicted nuclease of predicted toxin-antitoxin system
MKLLFDQNISFRILKKLDKSFSECKHVSDCNLQDSEDLNIWKFAKLNAYAIVTFDSDFYDISLINGHPPKIIWIRTGNLTTIEIAKLLNSKKDIIERFLYEEDYKKLSCLEVE